MGEWQQIETAPKETPVLVYFDDGLMEVSRWSVSDAGEDLGWWSNDGADYAYGTDVPTHWMPLPAPPGGCHSNPGGGVRMRDPDDLMRMGREMRDAIDAMELSMMGWPDLIDLPRRWGKPRHRNDLGVNIPGNCGQVYRICDALAELTRIINTDEFHVFVRTRAKNHSSPGGG